MTQRHESPPAAEGTVIEQLAPPQLRRSLGLSLIVLYGLGTTVGGGIYVLVGRIAGRAGLFAPISFVLAAIMISFTAFAFAELSARFPKSAGEAVYVSEGFSRKGLALAVGFMVMVNGIVSTAALTTGFVGYFQEMMAVPAWIAVVGIITLLSTIAIWGIGASVGIAAVLTIVEVGGLAIVIWAGHEAFATLPARWAELTPPFEATAWIGIVSGSFLAFYAFIGFEDMVNVAEEVRNPEKVLPTAILLTLVITTLLYIAVALVSILSVPPEELAETGAPLAFVYERATGESAALLSLISMTAVLNGALIQIIMASRVLYGMSDQGWLPPIFSHVNPKFQTPAVATATIGLIVILLALLFDIESLAEVTSLGLTLVAALVNAALVRLKLTQPATGGPSFPIWIPVAGCAVSVGFALLLMWNFVAPLVD